MVPTLPANSDAGREVLASVRELLESQSTMTLATVDDHGRPYATPLFFLLRQDLTLYWLSSAESRHSANLRRHQQVAVAVYPPIDRWKKIEGVQMEGVVREVAGSAERRKITSAYRRRFRLGTVLSAAIARATLYSFSPSRIRYLDNSRGFGFKAEVKL